MVKPNQPKKRVSFAPSVDEETKYMVSEEEVSGEEGMGASSVPASAADAWSTIVEPTVGGTKRSSSSKKKKKGRKRARESDEVDEEALPAASGDVEAFMYSEASAKAGIVCIKNAPRDLTRGGIKQVFSRAAVGEIESFYFVERVGGAKAALAVADLDQSDQLRRKAQEKREARTAKEHAAEGHRAPVTDVIYVLFRRRRDARATVKLLDGSPMGGVHAVKMRNSSSLGRTLAASTWTLSLCPSTMRWQDLFDEEEETKYALRARRKLDLAKASTGVTEALRTFGKTDESGKRRPVSEDARATEAEAAEARAARAEEHAKAILDEDVLRALVL
jgi:hypothetical protein